MYEIDLSTLMLIGIDNEKTKVITIDNEIIVNESCKKIVDNSQYQNLIDEIKFFINNDVYLI